MLLALAAALTWAQQGTPNLSRTEMEEFLRTAKVISHKQAAKGVTRSLRATLSDGKITHDAHIQSIDETRTEFRSDRAVELNFKDTYKFNIAGYRLATMLGLENVPVSVERKWAGKTSAFTWWVDDVMMDEDARRKKNIDPPNPDLWNKYMYMVRVFDQLICNTDRNLQNLLIQKDWNMWMIDHTRAFRIRKDLPNVKNLTRCDRVLLERMRALDKPTLQANLKPYLTNTEIDALLARRDKIVEFFDAEVKSKGEGAVLYEVLKK
ncbi:MAG: hypothetical protein ACE15B_02180 [Bryobacteraceae bacterium]